MTILDILGLKESGMVSLVGGGGKTTTMFKLGELLKEEGYSVLLTTTTGIFNPREEGYKSDYYFVGRIDRDFKPEKSTITVYGDAVFGSKLKGGDIDFLDSLYDREVFDFILIEADGARMLPIKAPGEREPVIPSLNTHTLGIIGMDALGQPILETVHRPDYFKEIVGQERMDQNLSELDIVKLVLNSQGLFKNSVGENIVFLNKADSRDRIESGLKIRTMLEDNQCRHRLILGNIQTGEFY